MSGPRYKPRDPGRPLEQSDPAHQPSYVAADPAFNGHPALVSDGSQWISTERFQYRTYSSPEYDPKWFRKQLNRISDEHRKWLRRHQDACAEHPEYSHYPVKPWHLKQQRNAAKQRARGGSRTECANVDRSIARLIFHGLPVLVDFGDPVERARYEAHARGELDFMALLRGRP